ncbi:probable small intestine urate exporter [Trichosurus vulpecula]|uniref:probable small intestine urate exporter n=1 Tax=Trichosurus vulpecula TaxID=9337 RepID=UPI00186B29ED|nr:probable small intestine urate exporter [Trichosurus vulpecula]
MASVADTSTTAKRSTDVVNMQRDEQEQRDQRNGFCLLRYKLAVILSLCIWITVSQQGSLSIAIVSMVNNTGLPDPSNFSTEGNSEDLPGVPILALQVPIFAWSPEIQGIVLSSFFYGNLLSSIPSGYLTGIFGAKKSLVIGLVMTSLLTILTPFAVVQGMPFTILIRGIQGIFQAPVVSAVPSFWKKWAPVTERSLLNGIPAAGALLGKFTILLVGGLISHSLGWPYILYIFGAIGLACCPLSFFLIYDDPMTHPYISDSEKEYIISSLPIEVMPIGWSLPIKAMVGSLPLWAIMIICFCYFWIFASMSDALPILFNNMFHLDIRNNGFLSSLPSIVSIITIILGSKMADFLLSRNIFSPVVIRKFLVVLGMLPTAVLFIAIPYVSTYTTIIILILSSAMNNLYVTVLTVNILEIAPRYNNFLNGLSNVFALLPQILVPTVVGFLTGQDSLNGWKNIFFLSAAIILIGVIIFLIFGRAEIQDWAKERTNTTTHF